jgi:hypothetical protein
MNKGVAEWEQNEEVEAVQKKCAKWDKQVRETAQLGTT